MIDHAPPNLLSWVCQAFGLHKANVHVFLSSLEFLLVCVCHFDRMGLSGGLEFERQKSQIVIIANNSYAYDIC